jgi:hypothetical protein
MIVMMTTTVILLNIYKFRENRHVEGRTFLLAVNRTAVRHVCTVTPCNIVKVKYALVVFVYIVTACATATLLHMYCSATYLTNDIQLEAHVMKEEQQ